MIIYFRRLFIMEKYNKAVMEINEMEAVDVLTASFGGNVGDNNVATACACGNANHTAGGYLTLGGETDGTITEFVWSDGCVRGCADH
jgi:hypothetical protein